MRWDCVHCVSRAMVTLAWSSRRAAACTRQSRTCLQGSVPHRRWALVATECSGKDGTVGAVGNLPCREPIPDEPSPPNGTFGFAKCTSTSLNMALPDGISSSSRRSTAASQVKPYLRHMQCNAVSVH
jgi:hypothetical protein